MPKRIKTIKIKRFFRDFPRILGEYAFLTFLVLLFFGLILGNFLFYKYNTLAQRKKPEVAEESLKFQEKTYQEVLNIWQGRNKKFKETDLKQYSDLFR